jgi:sugar phosphate isomerase/epimerase
MTIRVANAPCSWGVLEFGAPVQSPAAQVLDEMAATGYAGTELGDWGFLPTSPDALASAVARRRLALVGAFVPVALSRQEAFDEGLARAIRTARLLAAATVGSPEGLRYGSDADDQLVGSPEGLRYRSDADDRRAGSPQGLRYGSDADDQPVGSPEGLRYSSDADDQPVGSPEGLRYGSDADDQPASSPEGLRYGNDADDRPAGDSSDAQRDGVTAVAQPLRAAIPPLLVLSDDNATVPHRTARAGRVRDDDGLTPAQWDAFAARVERIARAVLDDTGLRTVFHHHCAGFVETPREIDALMARTSPSLVGLCLDTGHLTFAGGDPVSAIAAYGDRIWHVHVKDCDAAVARAAREHGWDYHAAVRHGIFCELGRGVVPFAAVRDALAARRYDGWIVVEQDVLPGLGTPAESARRNRDFLRGLGL